MNILKYFKPKTNVVHQVKSTKNRSVSIALNNGKVICADDYSSGDLQCPGCKQEMYFRKQHKRNLSRMVCDVRCTFVHAHDACESYEHKTAKKIIASTLYMWTFITGECSCGAKQTLRFGQTGTEEAAFGRFKLDVGVIQDENVIGCIEIFQSHRVDEEKKLYLNSRIKWVEVRAVDVLIAFREKKYTLNSVNVFTIQCESCKGKKREESERRAMHDEEKRMIEYNKIMLMRKTTPVLNFGKHRGQSVLELSQRWWHIDVRDFWYVRYLAGYAPSKFYNFPIPKNIREQAQEALKGFCIICEKRTYYKWNILCSDCWHIHRYKCLRCGKQLNKNYSFCWACKNIIS